MNIVDRFSENLTAIEYPKEKASWNIAGIIKDKNAFYRFDVRDMFNLPDGTPAQKGRTDSKADKMVLEFKDEWIILDMEEIKKYVKTNKIKYVNLDKIMNKSFKFLKSKNLSQAKKIFRETGVGLIPIINKNMEIKNYITIVDII